jgi:hypothetical protein
VWCLASLNRPEQCAEVIERLKKHGCSTPGVLFVNTNEDGDGSLYKNIELPRGWHLEIHSKNIGLCGAMNWVFNKYPNEPFYGMITDDEFIATDGWDKILVDSAGVWNISNGNNGWQSHRRIHGFMTIGGELARSVGYLMPQGLWHWYSDDVWEAIANRAALRRFCPDVKIENKHWMLGNAAKDKTYELSESRNVQDREIFLRWQAKELPSIMKRVMDGIGNPTVVYAV